jgi:RimJ/RimL family protein N-acetyltransferase
MKDKYKKFYMMFDKRFKNLILCSNLNSDCRVVSNGELNKKFMFNPTIRLETNLFSLVQLEQSHYEELYTVASNPIVWEQHQEKNRWQEENFLKFFQKAIQNNNGCFVVFNKNLNKIIGSTRFYLSTKDFIKIGYTFLSPEYWGTGANKEIKKAMLDYAFVFVDKVYFDVGKKNIRSRTAVEKLGAVLSDKTDEKVFYRIDKERYFGV